MEYSVRIIILLLLNNVFKSTNQVLSASDKPVALVWDPLLQEEGVAEDYIQQTMVFWTDERLKAAVPKPLIIIDSLPVGKDKNYPRSSHKSVQSTIIPASIAKSSTKLNRAGYPITVGKVFFQDGSSSYSCSASVITSNSKDMIVTAAHCVYSTDSSAFVKNFIFIPQYNNGARPYGTWPARFLTVSSNWARNSDYSFDVAFVLLRTLNGEHIENVVGSQAIGFNHGHSGLVYSFGYPSNYADGQIMTFCNATKYPPGLSQYTVDAMPCIMNQGSSGGPWLEWFTWESLSGVQTSVNSFLLKSTPNVIYGPYFGTDIQTLFNRAQNPTNIASSLSNSYMFLMGIMLLVQQCCNVLFIN